MIIRIYYLMLFGLAASLPTPLYFVTTDAGLAFAPSLAFDNRVTPTGFGLHVALVFLAPLLLLSTVHSFRARVKIHGSASWIALSLLIWMTAVATYGIYTSERPIFSFMLYAQAALPLIFYIYVSNINIEQKWARKTIIIFPIMSSISLIIVGAVFIYLLIHNTPIRSWLLLQEAFFGIKNIQPAISAVAVSIILACLSSEDPPLSRILLWVIFLIHAASLLMIWSRTGLVLIGIVFAVWWVWIAAQSIWTKQVRRRVPTLLASGLIMAVAGIANLTFAGVSLRPEQPTIEASKDMLNPRPKSPAVQTSQPARSAKLQSSRQDSLRKQPTPQPSTLPSKNSPPSSEGEIEKNLAGTDNRRWALLVDAVEQILERPVAGFAFQPLPPGTVLFGVKVKSHKLYPSHNQYTGMAIRAGIPAGIIFIALLFSFFWTYASKGGARFNGRLSQTATALIIGLIPASFFQLYFVVTQSALSIMLFLSMISVRFLLLEEHQNDDYSSALNDKTNSPATAVNP